MDQRVKLAYLDPQPGERVLDVGCGTGRHLRQLLEKQSDPCGVDLSFGMLKIASQARPGLRWCKQIPNGRYPSPVGPSVPCCVPLSESTWRHAGAPARDAPRAHARWTDGVLRLPSAMAAVGIEANFEEGVECRLGAYRHIVDDYRGALRALSRSSSGSYAGTRNSSASYRRRAVTSDFRSCCCCGRRSLAPEEDRHGDLEGIRGNGSSTCRPWSACRHDNAGKLT